MPPKDKPWLVYDGDCGFCRRWVLRWQALTGDRVRYRTADEAAPELPGIPRSRFDESVVLIEAGGKVYTGAEAVFRALALVPGGGWSLWAYRRVPGFAPAAEAFYRLVARNRALFSRITTWLWGRHLEPPTWFLSRWLFLRALGLVYLAAFASLESQVLGLVGADGVLPAAGYLAAVKQHAGKSAYWLAPTLCWLGSSDAWLLGLCRAGAALSLLLVAGLAPGLVLAALWLLYLSLATVSQVFLGYQWDNLLLEAGLLAIGLAPPRLLPRPSREPAPSGAWLWLLRWLLFRLMLSSGLVKLLSGDASWWGLTALKFHYETQPLPTWLGWYAHQAPDWFQRLSALGMFFVELALPFFIFAPRRPRALAGAVFIAFMGLIFLTGNYCFFNVLTAALCLLLFDDAMLRPLVPARLAGLFGDLSGPRPEPALKRRLERPAALLLLLASLPTVARLSPIGAPRPLARLHEALSPLRSVNGYGLFAVMTVSRPEIVLEGSLDGREWRAYEFKWKPGDPMRRPGFVAPHQPRLDWQMWFAALGTCERNPWLINLMARLLQGKPEALRLLDGDPFPEGPPRYLRALYYDYRFTDPAERRRTGAWWRRELKGLYCPVLGRR